MLRLRTTLSIAACGLLLLAAGVGGPLPQQASAQAPAALLGTYNVTDPDMSKFMGQLFLLPDGYFIWGDYYAPYRVTGNNVVELDCRYWRGEFATTSRRLTFTWTHETLKVSGTTELAYQGEPRPPARSQRPAPDICKWGKSWGRTTPPAVQPADSQQMTAGAPGAPLPAWLQAQTPVVRAVYGEIMLTTTADAQSADIDLWVCLVTQTYPRVELIEPGGNGASQGTSGLTSGSTATTAGERRDVFVWPDGKFRTSLRPGVSYVWSLLPIRCNTAGDRHPGQPPLVIGPADQVRSEEKVILACYVKDRLLTDCHAWWLVRP
jgi:hypothetical protein